MRRVRLNIVAVAVPLTMCGVLATAMSAFAAPVTVSNDAVIPLSSPAINLTIKANSVADSLAVNATSVMVSMSASTGGSFVISAPEGLSASTSGSGGSFSQTSCSGGAEVDTITQSSGSETYTISPIGSGCVLNAQNSTPASSVGVGSGGASGPVPYLAGVGPAASTTATGSPGSSLLPAASSSAGSASSTDTTSLLARLQTLRQELASLLAQAGEASTSSAPAPGASPSIAFRFSRDLQYRDRGYDVKHLQQELVSLCFLTAKPNGVFGPATLKAVEAFQKAHRIPATGYVGPITRQVMGE